MPNFKTGDQHRATELMADDKINRLLLYGGSRSGKSYIIIYAIIVRALKSAGSRHALLRFRFNHAKQSLWYDTVPKVRREQSTIEPEILAPKVQTVMNGQSILKR